MIASVTTGKLRPYAGIITAVQRMVDLGVIVSARYAATAAYPREWDHQDTIVAMGAVIIFSVVGEVNEVYRSWRAAPLREELRAALWSWVVVAPPLLLWLFLSKSGAEHSRVVTVGWFVASGAMLVLVRVAKMLLLRYLRIGGSNARTAGIVGATESGLRLQQQLADPAHGIRLAGIYDARNEDRCREFLGDSRLVGDIDQAVADAKSGKLDFVYIALPLKAESRISETVAALADSTATVQLVTDFSVFDLLHARWASVGEVPTVSVFDTPFQGLARFAKRVEDLLLGGLILIGIAPIMAAVALAVKLSSRGPVLFVQTRYGLNSRPISVYKFRTMYQGEAAQAREVQQATKDDARITPIGRFLRSSSLDELPQFLNVIKGDMSIVGPRPHAVAHNETYRALIHGYMLRHKVKPGITGWAQVNGFRGETDTLDKMRARVNYDLDYIENWNLSWDLEIILKTVFSVLRDKNAY